MITIREQNICKKLIGLNIVIVIITAVVVTVDFV